MYFCMRFLKKINIDDKKFIILYKRNMNIYKNKYSKTKILIHRGLYPVLFFYRNYSSKHKFGMYSFTRKPFAKPEKKTRIKKR